ncbi:MAG TPA: carboxymuconolactone decarboxylase family protein [Actinospica sp.]|nr:carboxymuconolactone decarboxylase family protein [Actinospica sp.]
MPTPEPLDTDTAHTHRQRVEHGRSVLDSVNPDIGGRVVEMLEDVSPALGEQVMLGFSEFYARPQLGPRDRQLVTISILTAIGGCEPQLEVHVNTALNVGLSPEQIVEAMLHATAYCGFPRAINATAVAARVFEARGLPPVRNA